MHDKTLNLIFDDPPLEAKAMQAEMKSLLGMVIADRAIMQESIAVALFGYTMKALGRKDITAKDVKVYLEDLAKKQLKHLTDDEGKALLILGIIEKKAGAKPFEAIANKVGRNDTCPCGSGLKYKTCCMDLAKEHDRREYNKCLG